MSNPILQEFEKAQMKSTVPEFNVGDTVEVRTKVVEGDKERVSVFTGAVIARKGSKNRASFIVRRIVQGEGVERTFLLHSPQLVGVRVRHKGIVRRAKLYYMRELKGKATRIKGTTVHGVEIQESAPADTGDEAPPSEE
jgi:large subunit ribosomal protein L19